ncbi:gag-pol polyprotein [Tanacetum coccineum]|uniref:Gag-pol polyprotein n=1 Tax=Tanacetum coccineum TaxID=301880 RepID=A0ABQ5GPH8_9ASTR
MGTKENATSFGGNNAAGQEKVVKCYNWQGEGHMARQCTQPKRPRNSAWFKEMMLLVQAQESGQTDDLDAYDSDCDDISLAKAVLMVNVSNNDITSDCNIISYEQYLQETQNAIVQDTNSSAQQDSMIMSVFEQMSTHVNKCTEATKETQVVNETLTDELERYKKRVKFFEERQNVYLNSQEKYIDSQMNDMILYRNEKFASFEDQIDKLKQNLSKYAKENESLMTSIQVLKKQTKEKEDIFLEKEIDLKKEKKELENIVFKVGQSPQTMHILTKPQVFYDNTHKQSLGYQNPFYLKKAQRIKPKLYDGIVSKKYDVVSIDDFEETLLLA